MKNLTPERRSEIIRLLKAIQADVRELRAIFEKLQRA
jgi:hypothetical protein